MKLIASIIIFVFMGLRSNVTLAADFYAAKKGQTPSAPYASWASAASNIQDAVNQAGINDAVWVGAGQYTVPPDATNYYGSLNVAYINKPLTLRSSNGIPSGTIIDGGGTNRGVFMYYATTTTNRLILEGFIITNCYALTNGGGVFVQPVDRAWTGVVQCCLITDNKATNGAGIYCRPTSKNNAFTLIVSNSIIANNRVATNGYGAAINIYGVGNLRVTDSILDNNLSTNAAAGIYVFNSTLTIENCVIRNNRVEGVGIPANATGGGGIRLDTCVATLYNTLMYNNYSYNEGGAIRIQNNNPNLSLYNCTIAGNSGATHGAVSISSAVGMNFRVVNSVIYSNYNDLNLIVAAITDPALLSFTNSCVTNYSLAGSGNITNAPGFADFGGENFRLIQNSPCVNRGLNQDWMAGSMDLDKHSRIDRFSGIVDMGCYEYLPRGIMFKVR